MRILLIVAALAAPVAPAMAQRAEAVRCSVNYRPAIPCRMTNSAGGGLQRMTFTFGNQRTTFVGKAQTGWWSGTLNGRPAMGYERNRGNMVFSTTDLKTVFAWWYPANEHGRY